MNYAQRLVRTVWAAQGPLAAVVAFLFLALLAFMGAWAYFFGGVVGIGLRLRELGAFPLLALAAYASGLATVLFYGAPLYAFLSQRARANWLTTALVGSAPGMVGIVIGSSPVGQLRTV